MSNEVQNNICCSQTIERLSDRLLGLPNFLLYEKVLADFLSK